MNKLIITRWNSRILTALVSEKRTIEMGLEDTASVLGNIYIGKVKKIVKNLDAAFVDFSEGHTGYYSFTENKATLFSDGHTGKVKEGDEIIVQVAKDAVKTKDPVLTGNLNFSGKYAVLTAAKPIIGFSSRIEDREWKKTIRPQIETMLEGTQVGVIIRTNAYGQNEKLLQELSILLAQYKRVLTNACYRTCYSLLYEADPDYIKRLKGIPNGSLKEVITDQPDLYARLQEFFLVSDISETVSLRFYEDKLLSLTKLYSLDHEMEQSCQKRVWLKSGGYLIIECTEAMVVIDVNTGKYSGKKDLTDTIRLINLEAAKEIAWQIRLRNLSGIIMVDFIDMDQEEDNLLLMDTLRAAVRTDPVKTTIVDMTQLGLVEMTRKKEKKPLWEQIAQVKV